MRTHDTDVVSTLRLAVAERVGQERFELWFGPGVQLVPQPGRVRVEVPNKFTLDWLRKHFRAHIEAAVSDVMTEDTAVEFQVNPKLVAKPAARRPASNDKSSGGSTTAGVLSPSDQDNGRPRRRFATFQSFVIGECNQVALSASKSITGQLGAITPLFLYGPSGGGKTHLLEAIFSSVREAPEKRRAVYLSAEQFTSFFLEALQGKGLPSFRRRYRGVDLLIVDDVQFLVGKRATQAELQHTMDTLLREGRQLAFAADRPPSRLQELGTELVARFCGGLVCAVQAPDVTTRVGILRSWVNQRKLSVPDDVLQFIASRLPEDARMLQGALNRVQATSQALGQPITDKLARESLADLVESKRQTFGLNDIEHAVCGLFELDQKTLKSKRRTKSVSHPRMLAMWLARKYTRAALSEIGDFFGRRSHTTVLSAHKAVERWVKDGSCVQLPDRDCQVQETIRQLEARMRAS